ncbi:Cilia- and flagella-associated protein 43 [Kappamyces sp. JEL0680]|nr:Cilia- and flagella-associated protein 43 [Kappamyces sp. JEL0680]
MSSKNNFYFITTKGELKLFMSPSIAGSGEKSHLTITQHEFKDHLGYSARIASNSNGEWVYTYGSDGLITVRSVVQPDSSFKIPAHDGERGGVFGCDFSSDYRLFFSVGHDGLMRRWDWKFTASGRRAAAEMFEAYDAVSTDLSPEALQFLEKIGETAELDDSPQEEWIQIGIAEKVQDNSKLSNEREIFKNHISAKLKVITGKMLELMKKNDGAPEIEKIPRSEFVIDIQEKERLVQETDNEVAVIRKAQERKNLEKRVLGSRIRKECWDSAEVVGQSIKSFKVNQVLGKKLDITNYPIRKPLPHDALLVSNIKRLRRIQLAVNQALNKNTGTTEAPVPEAADHGSADDKKSKLLDTKHAKLLYHPFELTTKERRRTQAFLLSETVQDIKSAFNQSFVEMVRAKQDEIAKIEEKNERIATILAQLQINEKIHHPELDQDEVPESVIEVSDSEVRAEKFVTAEELAKIAAKRQAAEDRLRMQGEDNSRQRALYDMMWGKLEDRKAQEEKEEIVKPEWMNKSKEDMTEEEKKLLKEFEKKMAIFKEEQDKHRKALETELRKLQAAISDIQDAFDEKLSQFSQYKLDVDALILQKELSMVKQTQYAISSDHDDYLETELVKRIEMLKQEKVNCTNEIPEIKKELEKAREDYESSSKRDKEIEKLFKKEFSGFEAYYEALSRLFKKRTTTAGKTDKDIVEEDLNPFAAAERDAVQFDVNPVALNQATDMPDGLSIELWNKLIDLRDKKISSEQDMHNSSRYLKEMQSLVQNVLEESDSIKTEMERAMTDLNQFLDYKFRNIHNIECLFELKQGQVEVPQAPIVTNYTDAVLLHRSVVEDLNEKVKHLGHLKVEALTEMKDYRKGIHALEWENKMHDFQAEDLIIRSRDIQLLRVTKEMQEFLRSGDIHRQASEVSNLEKVAEHSQKAHFHHLEDKLSTIASIKRKTAAKRRENNDLQMQIQELSQAVQERFKVQEGKRKQAAALTTVARKPAKSQQDAHKELFTRRRLVDLAKSQAQDIAILREELERLRLRTYPAFRA